MEATSSHTTNANAMIEARDNAGRGLSRVEKGTIIGIMLVVIGLVATRMVRMDRSFAAVAMATGAIAVIGGASYLAIEKGVALCTQRRYQELIKEFPKLFQKDGKGCRVILAELTKNVEWEIIESLSQQNPKIKSAVEVQRLIAKCGDALSFGETGDCNDVVELIGQLDKLVPANSPDQVAVMRVKKELYRKAYENLSNAIIFYSHDKENLPNALATYGKAYEYARNFEGFNEIRHNSIIKRTNAVLSGTS